jgi:predicted lysophospholipase L1 biosynthesis ABC-type transport system permease subunit
MGEEFTVHKCYKARGNKDDISIWIDLARAQKMLNKEGQINAILALECNCSADRLPIIRKEIAGILPETQVIERGTKATARAEARMAARKLAQQTLAMEESRALETKAQLNSFTATLVPLVIAGCSLLIGLLAFLNVRDRQAEVGILRALGLKSSQVYSIFLSKALVIGILGALAGLPLGHLVAASTAKSLAGSQGELLSASSGLFLLVLVATPLVTLLASWVPTLFAVQQDPSETLREA